MVRSNAVQCLEHFSYNPYQYQNRGARFGSPGIGLNAQSVVEVHHRHSTVVMGGGRDFKQAEEAISHAPLRRIRMDHSREEDCGYQRIGFNSHGESSYVEL